MTYAAIVDDSAECANSAAPVAGESLLVARDITKSNGSGKSRFDALRGISLDIRRGESVAVTGKSGSGKSTLMHLLALLDTPDGGSLHVEGRDARSLTAAALNRLRNGAFGFVFQQFFMIPNANVLDNVTLPLKIAGVPGRERKTRGLEVLEQVEMAEKANNRATDLSGGQKQRMVIARALVNEPKLIFADEPTGNLDSVTSEVIEDQLGIVQSVITAIVGVLNAFAAIGLFAAGFGIINTLLMSVQERTREIGLMKALGVGRSHVFALFSTEAVFIGFLGSAIGSLIAILFGTLISKVLANGILSDLTGLRILSFDPISVALVILLIMALAFVAGTLPAARAARQNPIDALRFE